MKKTFKRIIAAVLLCAIFSIMSVGAFAAAAVPTEAEAYNAIMALKSEYPEGTSWTNANYYGWKGGIYSGGFGCAGFAFMLSDAAFGDLPARQVTPVSIENLHVGDILRINNNSHSVIVTEIGTNSVTIAEGNYNNSVHWGRNLTSAQVAAADYMMTRYPVDENGVLLIFTDVSSSNYFYNAVKWAKDSGIVSGTNDGSTFSPNKEMNVAQMLQMLYAQAGSPDVSTSETQWYAKAQEWGIEEGYITSDDDVLEKCSGLKVVEMMYQAAGSPDVSGTSPFEDADSDAVIWAYSLGVTKGDGNGHFMPDTILTRARAVQFLYNANT